MWDIFEINTIFASRIAAFADCKVIVPQFRLCPEVTLYHTIDDAFYAFQYIALNSKEFAIDPDKIILNGLSSDAHASISIANLARNTPELKIRHLLLLNGCYDLLNSTHDFDEYVKQDKLLTYIL